MNDAEETIYDLLERMLADKIQGYAIVFKDKDGSMNFRNSDPSEKCSFYELLGMITQLQNDLMVEAREHDEEI